MSEENDYESFNLNGPIRVSKEIAKKIVKEVDKFMESEIKRLVDLELKNAPKDTDEVIEYIQELESKITGMLTEIIAQYTMNISRIINGVADINRRTSVYHTHQKLSELDLDTSKIDVKILTIKAKVH